MITSADLAVRIRALIDKKGYKRGEFLEGCGTTSDLLSTMRKNYPRLEVIATIAERLEISLSDLLSEEDLFMENIGANGSISGALQLDGGVKKMQAESEERAERLIVSSAADLSEVAVRFARRWDALDETGQYVVGNAIVQEERRIIDEKREKDGKKENRA